MYNLSSIKKYKKVIHLFSVNLLEVVFFNARIDTYDSQDRNKRLGRFRKHNYQISRNDWKDRISF